MPRVRDNSRVNSPPSEAQAKTTVFLLGVATVVAQALLLREAMAAMGGSEMAWGTVMALWLFGMGLGSRVGAATGSERLARILPVVVLAIAGLGIVLFRAAPTLIGAASGETLTTASAIWLWIVAVTPTAFAGGLAQVPRRRGRVRQHLQLIAPRVVGCARGAGPVRLVIHDVPRPGRVLVEQVDLPAQPRRPCGHHEVQFAEGPPGRREGLA